MGQTHSLAVALLYRPISTLLWEEKWQDSCQDCPDCPYAWPCLLMVAGKGGANILPSLEATIVGIQLKFGCWKWIIFRKLQYSMVESFLVRCLQFIHTKMNFPFTLNCDKYVFQRFLLNLSALLPESETC